MRVLGCHLLASLPAFFTSLLLVIVVSLLSRRRDPAKPITDIDGNAFDTSPMHNLGVTPLRDALRKLRPDPLARSSAETAAPDRGCPAGLAREWGGPRAGSPLPYLRLVRVSTVWART